MAARPAFLYTAGDVDGLAIALEAFMRDPSAAIEMGKRARERVVAEFSVDAEAAKIAAIYRELLGPPDPRSRRAPRRLTTNI